MAGPLLSVDLDKIEANTRAVTDQCRRQGISVTGVTKVTCGLPPVARAMLRGGVADIADARLENIRRLRASGITCPLMLLRIPPLSEVDEIVTTVDISLNSELSVIQGLSEAAERHGLVHQIILMVDLGDLREGIWPDDLLPLAREVLALPGVRVVGIGTNLTCYGGVLPSQENMEALVGYARSLEQVLGRSLRLISGGNSSALPLLASGKLPRGINHLRIGEALLLGRETIHRQPWTGTAQDAFLLSAEVIELKEKPSLPIGETGEDAFGEKPSFQDRGQRLRGILNVGREDAQIDGLTPQAAKVEILGASSDHLLLDVTETDPPVALGDRLSFQLSYAALLAAMTSSYVEKKLLRHRRPLQTHRSIWLAGEAALLRALKEADLIESLRAIGWEISESGGYPSSDQASFLQTMTAEIAKARGRDRLPLLIGCQETLSLAALLALSRDMDAFGSLWLDPRASFSPAHKVLGTALGYGGPFESLKAHLSPENVVIVGLREVDPKGAGVLTRSRVKVYTMEDVDELGVREVMHRGLRQAASGTRGIYVHFCPDVVENLGGPGTVGGLTYRETHLALEMIARTELLCGLDVVGLSPEAGKRVIKTTKEFILSAFGKRILRG